MRATNTHTTLTPKKGVNIDYIHNIQILRTCHDIQIVHLVVYVHAKQTKKITVRYIKLDTIIFKSLMKRKYAPRLKDDTFFITLTRELFPSLKCPHKCCPI